MQINSKVMCIFFYLLLFTSPDYTYTYELDSPGLTNYFSLGLKNSSLVDWPSGETLYYDEGILYVTYGEKNKFNYFFDGVNYITREHPFTGGGKISYSDDKLIWHVSYETLTWVDYYILHKFSQKFFNELEYKVLLNENK